LLNNLLVQWNYRVGRQQQNFSPAGKSFIAAQTHRTKWLQTLGGTPFADTGRGGCDTDPITTSYVSQKIYRKKNLHKPIKLLALCQILLCSEAFCYCLHYDQTLVLNYWGLLFTFV